MKKLLFSMVLSAVIIFCFLTGGTAALLASYYLWFVVVLLAILSLVMIASMAVIKYLGIDINRNFKGYTKSQLLMMHPIIRIVSFTASMFIAFIAYKSGFETVAVYYGIFALLAQVLTSAWISLIKGR